MELHIAKNLLYVFAICYPGYAGARVLHLIRRYLYRGQIAHGFGRAEIDWDVRA